MRARSGPPAAGRGTVRTAAIHRRFSAILAAGTLALAWLGGSEAGAASLGGRVADRSTGAAIAYAEVQLVELRTGAATNEHGVFRFDGLPPGRVSIRVGRIGYRSVRRSVEVSADSMVDLRIALEPEPHRLEATEVRGAGAEAFTGQRPLALAGARLRESLGRTLAETLDGEPGLDQRTLGPAPARPVLRGMGGNRLQVTEDGHATGDLSATAADHAVAIEPATSHEVAVIRGPAALLHASNVLAGVVEVRRDALPERSPTGIRVAATVQGETVNRGAVGALEVAAPIGPLAARAAGSLRRAGDIDTPGGRLGNTAIATRDLSGGAAWNGVRGRVGAWAASYRSRYGIPGGFLGGHARGVDIELDRDAVRASAEARPRRGRFESLALAGGWTRYYHRELESGGACGVSFGVLTGDLGLRASWRRGDARGAAGLTAGYRDHASGCLSFTPPTLERSLALVAYEERPIGPLTWRGAARLDARRVTPARSDSNKAGRIRERRFAGLSAGLAARWRARAPLELEATILHTFQAPGVEELFAEGPHLASYAYEIGNADLDPERGMGLEGRALWTGAMLRVEAAVFFNSLAGYLLPRDTGELEVGPGEQGLLQRYRMAGVDARLSGGELAVAWRRGPLALETSASLVRGTRTDPARALAFIPPPSGRLALAWQAHPWVRIGGAVRGALAQRRLGEFEAPTSSWAAGDLTAEWTRPVADALHSLVLTLENVTDTEYRRHLSRIRSVMPEAGRNLKALYRVHFSAGGP